MKKTTIERQINDLVKYHGSLRALSLASGIDVGYLSRLRSGEKTEPSSTVLFCLGLDRRVTYYAKVPNEDKDKRIAELETLIQKHNGKCDFMCNPDVCGWHLIRCPNCPKQWKIEALGEGE